MIKIRKKFLVFEEEGVQYAVCNKCSITKPFSEYHADKSKKYGIHTACRSCRCKYNKFPIEKACETCGELFKVYNGSEVPKKYCSVKCSPHKSTRFRITTGELEEMIKAQNNICFICKKKKDHTLHVDHCHKTNEIRHLLCSDCNTSLGKLEESVETIDAMSEYVLLHRHLLFPDLLHSVETLLSKACPSFDASSEYGTALSPDYELFDSPEDSM